MLQFTYEHGTRSASVTGAAPADGKAHGGSTVWAAVTASALTSTAPQLKILFPIKHASVLSFAIPLSALKHSELPGISPVSLVQH